MKRFKITGHLIRVVNSKYSDEHSELMLTSLPKFINFGKLMIIFKYTYYTGKLMVVFYEMKIELSKYQLLQHLILNLISKGTKSHFTSEFLKLYNDRKRKKEIISLSLSRYQNI